MKKRILSILLCCVMLVGLLPTVALAAGPDVWDGSTKAPSGGGKSESDPYLISTGEELAWLATLAAEGNYYVKLTNDIILNEGTFDQSGNFTKTGETAASTPHAWTPTQDAVWHIDGGNHYISGMYINSNDNDDVGLFSNLKGGSYVKNLTIKNSYVTASQSDKFFGVGVFAGQSSSNFTNCAGENNIVSASRYATGGIVGYSNSGSFNGVHTSGSISGGKSLGGLVGWVFGDTVFKNCWNEARVSGGNASGGIVGNGGSHSDLYNCANLGSGGITGSTGRTIKNCYNLSEVESYGGADKLLATLNDNLYEMDGMSDLNNWVMGTDGYPLPTGERFVDTTVYYDVWLDGVRVGDRNQNDILKNGLASYDKNTKTLYLHDGLVVTNPYNKRLLYTEGDINLCVDGSVEFRSAQKVGSGPIVIDLGEVGGSGNLKIYAPTGKSAAVTVTCEQSEYGIDVRSLTLDGDVSLTVRTKDTPCFANCNTITLLSSEAVLDAENGDEDGRSMLNSVSKVILPSTNPQKLYEGIGAELDCVEQFTTQDDNGYDCMYPHIRIAPEVYTLIDTLPKSLTVSMTEANTQTALSTWAAGKIRKGDITASNSEITVSDVVPAVAGSETNQSGTDGSFTVTVKLTKNGISKTTTIPGTITATAYTAPPHTHCICGGDTAVGDHTTHTDVTYQPWDGTSAIDYGDDNTAYVCLTDNVTIQSNLEIEAGKTLYLCLNGKTFASSGTTKIEMRENSHFILCDCAGGGTIDGADSCWGGAGIYLHNSTMDMYGGKITGGHTGNGGGGAIALDDVNCVFNMYGGEISGNKADRYAGAIFLNGTLQSNKGGTVNLYGGTIKNNSAQLGGAIYAVYGGTVNLFGGEISGNKATVNGGGAICLNHSGVLNMTGGTIAGNEAKTDGGAVNLYASTFTFSDGTISNNYSAEYGGAVYLSISGKLNMTGGEICNNTAAEEGGAVHVYGEKATFNFSGGTITGNEAKKDGGAVYLNQELSTLNMTGGEISGNKATRNGGAVYMFRATSTLNLSGGTIKNNTAGSSGGAVYFNTTSDSKIQGILNISGDPVVKDNTVSDKTNNIAMKTGKTLSIVGDMTDGASVGITTESTNYPVVFSDAYDTNYAGYFFADDENAHVNYNSEKKLELAADVPETYTVTVQNDGNGSGSATPATAAAGTEITLSATANSGYHFKEWQVVSGSVTITDNKFTMPASDVTVKAIFEENAPETYTVSVQNDGNGSGSATPATAAAGTEITLSATANSGYHFKEWQVVSGSVTITDNKFTMPASDVTVKAIFEENAPETYTVSFNANGGTGSMADVTGVSGSYNLPANGFIAPTGKQFKGWATSAGGTVITDTTITVTEDITLYAIWEDIPVTTYTVSFNANGGSVTPESASTGSDGRLSSLPTPTRSGSYSFDGWYTAASGGTKVTTSYQFTADTTVYAHWTYTGGSSSGGGYTYYTIKATAGVNGEISPSGSVSVRSGKDQTFTITPDKGYAISDVKIDGKSVGAVKSYTFENVKGNHTIKAIFMKANGNPQTGVFVDVPEGSYYEETVAWAVENGITKGTSDTTFDPNGICTRAQAVTFLWRAAGSPAPKTSTMPFTDVKAGSYYYDAVLWAVENGITNGTSDTTFSPDVTCSRAQIVTFLWRSQEAPAAGAVNPFTDMKADAYYAEAVLWAVKEDVTKGTTDTTFSPNADCTRAQIVTFIWRALAE